MIYKANNLHVPPWGLPIRFPTPFGAAPSLKVSCADPNRSVETIAESPAGFTLFVYDRNGKGVGGLASYIATDENGR